MPDAELIDVMKRVESWPVEDRRKLIALARLIEAQHDSKFDLTAEDWKIIDRRVAGTTEGELVPDAEMEALFAKYRVA